MPILRGGNPMLLNDTNWIEEVWDGLFLDRWYAESPIPKICNTRVLDKIKNVGQIIHFRVEPVAVVVPHIKDQPIQWSPMVADQRQISVDYAYSAAHRLDNIDAKQLGNLPVMSKVADSITKMHSQQENQILFPLLPTLSFNQLNKWGIGTTGFTGTTGVISQFRTGGTGANVNDYAIAQVARMRTLFNRRRVPKNGRFIVVPPEVEEILINSDQATFQIGGHPSKALEDGEWGVRVCGFDIISSEFVAGVGTQASPWLCMAGVKGAIGFGRQVTEMESGIQLQDYYGKGVRALNSFGAGLLYPDGVGLWQVRTT